MGESNTLPFPFELKELDPEEKLELLRVYKTREIDTRFDFVSVGPKKYKQPRSYCEHAAYFYNIPVRSTDIFVNTYPRSGTTWTQELVWLVANDFDYTRAKEESLRDRYAFIELFTLYTNKKWQDEFLQSAENKEFAVKVLNKMSQPITEKWSMLPSPRFIKTHLALSLLPPSLLDTAKVVYVARDPRDVAVSAYHFACVYKARSFPGSFKDFWDLFYQGLAYISPYFEHVKEAWNLRNHPNMLFLFYEDLLKDLPASVHRVADFLHKEVTDEQMARVCEHLSFDNFKKNNSVNSEILKQLGLFKSEGAFVRKGKAGGWRDYFDEEMTQQAEKWIEENLKDTDLRFPSIK